MRRWAAPWRRAAATAGSAWAAVALGLVAVPLAAVRFVPACDLPNHVAIATVLLRLWRGGEEAAGVAAHYAANPQPLPYHLAYVLLGACTAAAGPLDAGRLAMAVLAAATVVAAARLVRALGAHPAAVVGVVPAFFGLSFTWGFVATLTGLPAALWALAAAARAHAGRGRWWPAVVAAAVATVAHIIWVVPLAACAALCVRPRWLRRLVGVGLAVAVAAAMALRVALPVPVLGSLEGPYGASLATFDSLYQVRLRGSLGEASVPGARAWHVGLLAVALLWRAAVAGRRGARPSPLLTRWLLATVAVGLAMPHTLRIGPAFGEMLDFRFWPLAEVLALSWCCRPPAAGSGRVAAAAPALGAAVAACGLGFVLSLVPPWQAADRAAGAVVALVGRLPAHGTLGVVTTYAVKGRGVWPRIADHLPAYYVTGAGDSCDSLFVGGHLPLRTRDPWARLSPLPPLALGPHTALCEHHGPDPSSGVPADAISLGTAAGWTCSARAGGAPAGRSPGP